MATYAFDPKLCKDREGKVEPVNDSGVKQGFIDAIPKMYTLEQATII